MFAFSDVADGNKYKTFLGGNLAEISNALKFAFIAVFFAFVY